MLAAPMQSLMQKSAWNYSQFVYIASHEWAQGSKHVIQNLQNLLQVVMTAIGRVALSITLLGLEWHFQAYEVIIKPGNSAESFFIHTKV